MPDSRSNPSASHPGTPELERPGGARPESKRRWRRPRLIDHGDVRELTLGTSVGQFESGAPGTFRP